MDMTWGKLRAVRRNQGSRHTRILGNAFKIRYVGAVWSSPRSKACNFTKHGHIQSVLFNTPPAACIKKAVWMKTNEELFQKAFQSPRVPRVVLKSNSQYGQQDPHKPRRKIILGPIKRLEELQGNLQQHRGLQNFWSISFCNRAAGYNTWEQGQEVDREVREPPAQGIFLSGLEPDAEDQQVQQKITGFDRRHDQQRDLRILRKFFQTAMSWLQYLLGNRKIYCSCGRNMKFRRAQRSSSRTTTKSPQSLAALLRRIAVVGPNTDLLNDKECTTRRNGCLKRPVRKSMDATQWYLHDGTPANRTERCQPSGGKKNT